MGLVLTLLGLTAFQVVLTDAGDRLLARLGTVAYLVGVVLWIVADAIELAGGRFIFELERDYVVLACLAIAAFGGAILRTRILPRWVGGIAVVWAIVWTVLYLARIGEAPLASEPDPRSLRCGAPRPSLLMPGRGVFSSLRDDERRRPDVGAVVLAVGADHVAVYGRELPAACVGRVHAARVAVSDQQVFEPQVRQLE